MMLPFFSDTITRCHKVHIAFVISVHCLPKILHFYITMYHLCISRYHEVLYHDISSITNIVASPYCCSSGNGTQHGSFLLMVCYSLDLVLDEIPKFLPMLFLLQFYVLNILCYMVQIQTKYKQRNSSIFLWPVHG